MKLNNVRKAAKLHERREGLLQILGDVTSNGLQREPSVTLVETAINHLFRVREAAAAVLAPVVEDQLREAIRVTEEQLRELGVEVDDEAQ